MPLRCIGHPRSPPVEEIVQPGPEERIACLGQRGDEDSKVDFVVEPVSNGVGGRWHRGIRYPHETRANLTVDDLLDHDRDRRGEPETHRQGDQQESREGSEAEPEAAPWSSCRPRSRGPRLLSQALVNGRPQLLRDLVLRQGGAEQSLEATVGCLLRLARGAGPEMLGHLVGLRWGELSIEIEIELGGWPLARHILILKYRL